MGGRRKNLATTNQLTKNIFFEKSLADGWSQKKPGDHQSANKNIFFEKSLAERRWRKKSCHHRSDKKKKL